MHFKDHRYQFGASHRLSSLKEHGTFNTKQGHCVLAVGRVEAVLLVAGQLSEHRVGAGVAGAAFRCRAPVPKVLAGL